MNKCIIIPDSFKGSMTSIEVCEIMKKAILKHFPNCETVVIPIADGGEGTVDSFCSAIGGEKVFTVVSGPYFKPIKACYLKKNDTAIIEMAKVAGLPLVGNKKNPSLTTSFGVGELILHAIKVSKCHNIIIGLGGSCTNDGGTGLAAALGTKFFNDQNILFLPVGKNLNEIKRIDITKTKELLRGCKITAMCDVDNPMYGENGAAVVFAKQKGADDEMISLLDNNLKVLCDKMKEYCGIDVKNIKGGGAAGAIGAGIVAFLGGELKSGIDIMLDTVKFDEKLNDTDYIFTGEGKFDSQSLHGKVISGIGKRALKSKCPVIAVVGDIGDGIEEASSFGVGAVFSINHLAVPFSKARLRSKKDLADTMDNILKLIKLSEKITIEGKTLC